MFDSPSAPSRAFQRLNILVVEDEAMVSLLIEDMLMQLGCRRVIRAASIAEALALLERERPDAAVLDVNLGGEKVYPLAERLDALHIPFVFSTGYGREGMPDPWARHAVIQKPFPVGVLAEGLRQVLRTW